MQVDSHLEKSPECLKTLYEILQSPEGISPFDIYKKTGTAYSTVLNCVRKLAELGTIDLQEVESRKGGRKLKATAKPGSRAIFNRVQKKIARETLGKIEKTTNGLDIILPTILERLERRYEKTLGFKDIYAKISKSIKLDGGVESTYLHELVTLTKGLSSRMHFHAARPGGCWQNHTSNFRVIKKPSEHEIIAHVLEGSNRRFLLKIVFRPPLDRNDLIEYEVQEEMESIYEMTKDSILKKIEDNKWLLEEPYEWSNYLVLHPTEKLVIEVTFPEGYPIEKGEFDVTVGESIYKLPPEVNRLKAMGGFSHEVKRVKHGPLQHELRLDVDNAVQGLCYWIKWIPPMKEVYKKVRERAHKLDKSN